MADDRLLGWLVALSTELRRAKVPHALAGGLAVAVWARPRATADIDLVVPGDDAAIASLRAAAHRAGLLQTGRRATKLRRITLLRMLAPPGGPGDPEPVAVDLLIVPPALQQLIFDRVREVTLRGAGVPVVSPEDAIVLKLLRFSAQDRVDIKAIAAEQRLDRRYLRARARALRVLSRLRGVGMR